jgi:hypothetical protein
MRTQADLERLIRERCEEYADEDKVTYAIMADFTPDDIRTAATAWIQGGVRHMRREKVREIERQATRPAPASAPRRPQQYVPGTLDLGDDWRSAVADWEERYPGVKPKRMRYNGHTTTIYGLDRAGAFVSEMDETDESDFLRRRESADRIDAMMRDMITRRATEMFASWTEELLSSEFALPDGRRVTWGSATATDHRLRIDMLVGQTVGIAETAALHERALQDMGKAKVATLADLEKEHS